MIMITGLGRCGTSFMALLFKELGFGMGTRMHISDLNRAGMEFDVGYSINRDIFHYWQRTGKVELDLERKAPYWGCEISLRDRMLRLDNDTPPDRNEGKIEVFKDPRATWSPLIVRAWWEVRKDLKLIIMHRGFKSIIESRRKVSIDYHGIDAHFQDPKRAMRLDEFKQDFADFYTEVLSLNIPHTVLFYPNFFELGPDGVYHKILREAGVNMTKKLPDPHKGFERAWNKVYNKDKVHSFKEVSEQ